jgi:hypothetical protein
MLRLESLEDRNLLSILAPVTTLDNDPGFTPNHLVLTLRDAVIQANYDFNNSGGLTKDTILLKAGIFNLNTPNTVLTNEPLYDDGDLDLDINGSMTIQGVPSLTIINQTNFNKPTNATQDDRVMEVTAGTVLLQNLVIQGGHAVDNGASEPALGPTNARERCGFIGVRRRLPGRLQRLCSSGLASAWTCNTCATRASAPRDPRARRCLLPSVAS